MSIPFYILLFLFLGLCVLLSFVILIQESKNLGLGASFGGDVGDSLFGTSTANVVKKFTAYLTAIFFILCLILSFWTATTAQIKVTMPSVNDEEMSSD